MSTDLYEYVDSFCDFFSKIGLEKSKGRDDRVSDTIKSVILRTRNFKMMIQYSHGLLQKTD